MTVAGQNVEITHDVCSAENASPVQDPRETSFGELAELTADAT